MKETLSSAFLTNILLFCLSVIGGLMSYIFISHANLPWHGSIGVRVAVIEEKTKAAVKRIVKLEGYHEERLGK